jgi:hypothetical protein
MAKLNDEQVQKMLLDIQAKQAEQDANAAAKDAEIAALKAELVAAKASKPQQRTLHPVCIPTYRIDETGKRSTWLAFEMHDEQNKIVFAGGKPMRLTLNRWELDCIKGFGKVIAEHAAGTLPEAQYVKAWEKPATKTAAKTAAVKI